MVKSYKIVASYIKKKALISHGVADNFFSTDRSFPKLNLSPLRQESIGKSEVKKIKPDDVPINYETIDKADELNLAKLEEEEMIKQSWPFPYLPKFIQDQLIDISEKNNLSLFDLRPLMSALLHWTRTQPEQAEKMEKDIKSLP